MDHSVGPPEMAYHKGNRFLVMEEPVSTRPPSVVMELSGMDDRNRCKELSTSQKTFRTHMIYSGEGLDDLGWYLGDLSLQQLYCLNLELRIYREWMTTVVRGEAPMSSYNTPDQANEIFRAKHRSKYESAGFEKVRQRAYYEEPNHNLSILCETTREDWPYSDHNNDYSLGSKRPLSDLSLTYETDDDGNGLDYEEQPLGSLLDFLCDPYDSEDEFALGFRALPMTYKIIKDWLALGPKNWFSRGTVAEPNLASSCAKPN